MRITVVWTRLSSSKHLTWIKSMPKCRHNFQVQSAIIYKSRCFFYITKDNTWITRIRKLIRPKIITSKCCFVEKTTGDLKAGDLPIKVQNKSSCYTSGIPLLAPFELAWQCFLLKHAGMGCKWYANGMQMVSHKHTHTHIYTNIYIYIQMHMPNKGICLFDGERVRERGWKQLTPPEVVFVTRVWHSPTSSQIMSRSRAA